MPQNWKTYKLKDLCTKIGSGSTPRGGKEAYQESGISLIRSQNVLDFTFSENGLAFIDQNQADKLKNVEIEPRDVLLNITGDSVARICQVPNEWLPARVNQHVAIIRTNKKKLNPEFLKYLLLSSINKNHLLTLASAGATRNAITKSMIEDFEVTIPENIEEQTAIASILSALDDKIELNLQQNKTLEEMAMALYKHWFVDFGPFQEGEFVESELGMIPKGWEVKRLEELADVGSSKRIFLKEYVEVGIPFFRGKEIIQLSKGNNISTELFISMERYKDINSKFGSPSRNDILISSVGTIGVSWLVESDEAFYFKDGNLTWIKNYQDRVNGYFISQWLKSYETQEQIKSETIGSTQQALTISALKQLKVTLPPKESFIIKEVSEKLLIWNELFLSNKREIKTLTNLRDSLLSKLISGEVRVKDVEHLISAR